MTVDSQKRTDQELVTLAKGSDFVAFEELVSRHAAGSTRISTASWEPRGCGGFTATDLSQCL